MTAVFHVFNGDLLEADPKTIKSVVHTLYELPPHHTVNVTTDNRVFVSISIPVELRQFVRHGVVLIAVVAEDLSSSSEDTVEYANYVALCNGKGELSDRINQEWRRFFLPHTAFQSEIERRRTEQADYIRSIFPEDVCADACCGGRPV